MNVELSQEEYEILISMRENKQSELIKRENIRRAKKYKNKVVDRIREYGYDVTDIKFKSLYSYVKNTIALRAEIYNHKINSNVGIDEETYILLSETLEKVLPRKEGK